MFDKIKKFFEVEKPQEAPKENKEPKKKSTSKKKEPELSPKELATQNGEPYIAILSMELDPNDVNNGSFELDWNDKFVINLIRAGYKIKQDDSDQVIVDRWFQSVCRNIALEIYEQEQADPSKRSSETVRIIQSKDIGNGRTEVS